MIGNDITIVILALQGKKVRLGIEAPKHVSVHREEIFQSSANNPLMDQEDQDE